jgi:MFS family permease
MNEELGFSYELLNDSYAAGVAALAIGSPLLIPFALKFGRRPIYLVSTAAQLAFAIWSAKIMTTGDLIAVNTLNCFFGALAEVIVQMTVADVFFVHQRGRLNSLYCWVMSIGTTLAPLAAGYIARDHGWRWIWWWMTISFAVMLPIYIFAFEESKYDKIIDDTNSIDLPDSLAANPKDDIEDAPATGAKSAEATIKSEKERHADDVEIDHSIPLKTYVQRLAPWSSSPGSLLQFFRHSYQPLLIFATIPAVFYMCLVYSIINATTTVNITLFSQYMYGPPYNFNPAQVGLMSLPGFIGSTIGLLVCGPLSDWLILFLSKRNNGIYEPEMRLWVIAAFIPFVPAGIFMFGFGLANGSSWQVVAVGSGIQAFALAPASSIALTYLTDSYEEVISSHPSLEPLLTRTYRLLLMPLLH